VTDDAAMTTSSGYASLHSCWSASGCSRSSWLRWNTGTICVYCKRNIPTGLAHWRPWSRVWSLFSGSWRCLWWFSGKNFFHPQP